MLAHPKNPWADRFLRPASAVSKTGPIMGRLTSHGFLRHIRVAEQVVYRVILQPGNARLSLLAPVSVTFVPESLIVLQFLNEFTVNLELLKLLDNLAIVQRSLELHHTPSGDIGTLKSYRLKLLKCRQVFQPGVCNLRVGKVEKS